MKAQLSITRPGAEVQVLEMTEGSWTIGRMSGDLIMRDGNVSSKHATLSLSSAGLIYTDVGSTNGSFVAGQRVAEPVALQAGSVVTLGSSTITIVSLEAAALTAAGTQVMQAQPAATPQPAIAAQPAMTPAVVTAGPAAVAPPAAGQLAVPAISSSGQAHAGQQPAAAAASPGVAASPSAYSHPEAPIRHSYPVAIKDASLGTAMGLMMQTLPYALVRFGILLAVSAISTIWLIVTIAGGVFFGSKSPFLGWVWVIIGGGAYGWLWQTIVRYVLYLIKLGHIAVLTELVTQGSVNHGQQGMFEYGKNVVKSRFGEVNAMFALDLLIAGIIRAFNGTLNFIAGLLPIPGLDGVMGIVNRVVHASATYVDETMFSYNLARGDENVWRSSKDGLIYYAQNSKEVLKTAVWIVVLDYALSAAAWVVMLAPAFALAYVLPQSIAGWAVFVALVIAVFLASNIRSAFLRPLFLIMIMTKFHVSAQGQTINAEWDGRLTTASAKFKELKDKALAFRPGAAKAETNPAPLS